MFLGICGLKCPLDSVSLELPVEMLLEFPFELVLLELPFDFGIESPIDCCWSFFFRVSGEGGLSVLQVGPCVFQARSLIQTRHVSKLETPFGLLVVPLRTIKKGHPYFEKLRTERLEDCSQSGRASRNLFLHQSHHQKAPYET